MYRRFVIFFILVLLHRLELSHCFDISLHDLCLAEKIETISDTSNQVCTDCNCLQLNSDSFLPFLENHLNAYSYEDDALFKLTYGLLMEPIVGKCQVIVRLGSKAIDYLELSNGTTSVDSRSAVFDLDGVHETILQLQGKCNDGTSLAIYGVSVTSLAIIHVQQPVKYIFRESRVGSDFSRGQQNQASMTPVLSEVLNDHILYTSQDQSMSVTEVLNAVNSKECNLMGSSDAVLLNKIVFPSMEEALTVPDHETGVTVLCSIFTMEKNHATKVKAVTDTWGRKCTQFLAFSTVEDASIPSIHVHHLGAEEYRNMWQKSRAIWKYIHAHYRHDFDYFLLGGDDMYYVMENLYLYLNSEEVRSERARGQGVYLGRVFKKEETLFNSGGPGYLLDGVALDLLIANLDESHCNPNLIAPHEDLNIALCLSRSVPSLLPYNTIDPMDRQRFHPFTAGFHYTYQPSVHFPRLPMDHWYDHYDHFIRSGFDCCSVHSISFHFVWVSLMYEMDDYLYRCPQIAKDYYYGFYGETHYFRSIKVINHEENL